MAVISLKVLWELFTFCSSVVALAIRGLGSNGCCWPGGPMFGGENANSGPSCVGEECMKTVLMVFSPFKHRGMCLSTAAVASVNGLETTNGFRCLVVPLFWRATVLAAFNADYKSTHGECTLVPNLLFWADCIYPWYVLCGYYGEGGANGEYDIIP